MGGGSDRGVTQQPVMVGGVEVGGKMTPGGQYVDGGQ